MEDEYTLEAIRSSPQVIISIIGWSGCAALEIALDFGELMVSEVVTRKLEIPREKKRLINRNVRNPRRLLLRVLLRG